MITITDTDKINGLRKVEINGAWVTALTADGKHISIRAAEGEWEGWYDDDHAVLMEALEVVREKLISMLESKGIKRPSDV